MSVVLRSACLAGAGAHSGVHVGLPALFNCKRSGKPLSSISRRRSSRNCEAWSRRYMRNAALQMPQNAEGMALAMPPARPSPQKDIPRWDGIRGEGLEFMML